MRRSSGRASTRCWASLANSPSLSTCALARQERRFWALETARANGPAQQEPAVSETNCANKARQFGRCSLVSGTLRKRRTAWWAREDSNLQPDRYERSALTVELRAP